MSKGIVFCISICFGFSMTGFSQQDSNKIANLDIDKLKEIEKTIKKNDSLTDLKIKTLESSITNQNFIKVLKTANVEKFKNDVASLKGRYVAGARNSKPHNKRNKLLQLILSTTRFTR